MVVAEARSAGVWLVHWLSLLPGLPAQLRSGSCGHQQWAPAWVTPTRKFQSSSCHSSYPLLCSALLAPARSLCQPFLLAADPRSGPLLTSRIVSRIHWQSFSIESLCNCTESSWWLLNHCCWFYVFKNVTFESRKKWKFKLTCSTSLKHKLHVLTSDHQLFIIFM